MTAALPLLAEDWTAVCCLGGDIRKLHNRLVCKSFLPCKVFVLLPTSDNDYKIKCLTSSHVWLLWQGTTVKTTMMTVPATHVWMEIVRMESMNINVSVIQDTQVLYSEFSVVFVRGKITHCVDQSRSLIRWYSVIEKFILWLYVTLPLNAEWN